MVTSLQVVRTLLVSLAHHEAYFSLFNDFVHLNPSVLEDDSFGFMKHCMALLNFENKQTWFRNKLQKLRCVCEGVCVCVCVRVCVCV